MRTRKLTFIWLENSRPTDSDNHLRFLAVFRTKDFSDVDEQLLVALTRRSPWTSALEEFTTIRLKTHEERR